MFFSAKTNKKIMIRQVKGYVSNKHLILLKAVFFRLDSYYLCPVLESSHARKISMNGDFERLEFDCL